MAEDETNPQPSEETTQNPQENLAPANSDGAAKGTFWEYVAELVIAGAVGTGVWLFGEHLTSHGHTFWGTVIDYVAFCIFFATVPLTTVKFWARRTLVWSLFGVFCALMALAFVFSSWPARKVVPHFVLALRIGDSVSTTILLTNDFLFESHLTNTAVLSNGSFLFSGHSLGCVVIPVTPGESNKVFTFIFENDSHQEISDLEGAVGFPTGWRGKLDPKWKKTEASLIFPRLFQLSFTNLQFWSAVCPWTLYPFDRAEFPAITNSCTIEHTGSSFKEGFFVLMPRAAGLESWLSANVLFVPVPSNAFVPFLAKQVVGKDGKARLSLTKKQLERYGNVTLFEGQKYSK